jgi:SAM-dependent methyltransferase
MEINSYYRSFLKKKIKYAIRESRKKEILEIGCGNGELLHYLNPKSGFGIDMSSEKIYTAMKKYKRQNIEFRLGDALKLNLKKKFDIILLIDVVEHINDMEKLFFKINEFSNSGTRIFFWNTNPRMFWLSDIAEKLKLKTEEGFCDWTNVRRIDYYARSFELLLPIELPVISHIVNHMFHKIPFIRKLGYLQLLVLKKE